MFPLESVRTEAAKIDAAELKGIAEKSIAEECSGCGASPDLSFVILVRTRFARLSQSLHNRLTPSIYSYSLSYLVVTQAVPIVSTR